MLTLNFSPFKVLGAGHFGCHIWIQQRQIHIHHSSFSQGEELLFLADQCNHSMKTEYLLLPWACTFDCYNLKPLFLTHVPTGGTKFYPKGLASSILSQPTLKLGNACLDFP